MFRRLHQSANRAKRAGRRGAILVVVLALLTMFALIAIVFLFLAMANAEIARLYKEAAAGRGGGAPPPPNPDALVNQAFAKIIFDEFDYNADPTNPALLSAIRGHSLARSMYGYHGNSVNLTPYSGIGTFHEPTPATIDSARWVNYSGIYPKFTAAGFVFRDPEWTGVRDETQVAVMPWAITAPAQKTFIPKNAPYTYQDLNNSFLAQLIPTTGEVAVPSFVRPWHFTMVPPNVASGNIDWLTPRGRLMTVRPRPVDQLTQAELQAVLGTPVIPPTLTAAQVGALNAYIDAKIQSGELIPYPGQNADGSYTGDLQLLTGGVGTQKNDTILVDIGLPVQEWPPNSGKLIKPLAAMLIYDLDGFLDLNSHGNTRLAGGHTSYAGFGPWEVNLSRNDLLGPEANSVVGSRQGSFLASPGPFSRNGLTSLSFDRSGVRLPQYSVVNWDGTGTIPAAPSRPIQLPSFAIAPATPNPFFVRPLFGGAGFFDDNIYDNPAAPPPPVDPINKYVGHPGLFNPSDWGSPAAGTPPPMPATPFTYPLSDLQRLRYTYADELSVYQQMSLAKLTNATGAPIAPMTSLVGTFPAGDTYRLDPAHAKRMLFTMLSANLDRPGLMPNFPSTVPGTLQLVPGQPHPTNPSSPGSFPSSATVGPPDFISTNDWRNARASLGPIDLNRPLSDYRTDPNTPLGQPSTTVPADTSNTGNNNQAAADRQNLARDIFARLIIATGAQASVFTQPTVINMVTYQPGDVYIDPTITAPGTPQYAALRYLAQVAVNIVDDLDIDDINTTFVWAPTDGGMPPSNLPLTEVTGASLPAFLTANMTAPDIQNRVVYGFERPRLVINEAYGELTNGDEAFMGAPTQNARVRFWVELMNPTNAPYAPGTTGPLGSGAVTLYNAAAATPYNPYQLQVASGAAGATDLANNANPAGDIQPANINLTFDFSTAAGPQQTVAPINGVYNPVNGVPGFAVVGPPSFTNVHLDGGGTNPVEFQPDLTSAPFNQMIQGTAPAAMSTTAMEYTFGAVPSAATLEADAATNPLIQLRRNLIVLRRLVNPYLPPAPTNPYITVDKMDWVPAFDAVARSSTDTTANRNPKGAANITTAGFEAATAVAGRRFAIGRVQPYAGYANAIQDGMGNTYTAGNNTFPAIAPFPTSMVIQQNPQNPPAVGPLQTFFQNNGMNNNTTPTGPAGPTANPPPPAATTALNDTIMAPFDWLVHFDRQVINPLELLQVQAVKPYEVTHYFLYPPAAAGQSVRRGLGEVPWFGVQGATGLPICDANTGYPIFDVSPANPNAQTNNGLFRALEMLRVKSWTYGEAHGGRVRGQVNLNTIQDIRILRAMLDAQAGNNFTQTDIDNLWTNFIISNAASGGGGRTFNSVTKTQADGATSWVVPVAGKTIDDADPSDPNFVTELPNLDRPIKPLGVGEYAPGPAAGPYPYAAAAGSGIQDTILRMGTNGYPRLATPLQGHPYLRDEMVRKLYNNATTVSNVFAVHLTIVYHEVRSDPATGGPMAVNEGLGTRYLLGKEVKRETPGDMRHSFFAIVDRTQLMVAPGGGPFIARPFYSSVENIVAIQPPPAAGMPTHKLYLSNAVFTPGPPAQLTVFTDGRATTLSMAQGPFNLVLGVGSNQEIVAVSNIDPVDGSLHIGGTVPLNKPHARGELVANGVPGNPGPVGPVNLNNLGPFDVLTNPISNYKAVVPYIVKIE